MTVSSLADRLRLRLRGLPGPEADWLTPVNEALAEAYRRASADDLAEVALLAAVWLDARGRFDEAIANVDFALAVISDPSTQRAHLLCARAALLAIAGRVGAARATLERAREAPQDEPRSRLEVQVYEALVACLALDDAPTSVMTASLGAAERAHLDWLASGLTVWLVPWLAARGSMSEAATWTQALAARAAAVAHEVRSADAASLRIALEATGGLDVALAVDPAQASAHGLARWRGLLTAAHADLMRGRWDDARRALTAHEAQVARMNPGFRTLFRGFLALLDAYEGIRTPAVPPPEIGSVTAISLPALLASAEAAALAGSIEACVGWLRALAAVPDGVVTSLEWPVSIDRIRALLLMRLGRVAQARTAFARASRAMESAGNPIEGDLTRLHRAEAEAIAARRPDRGLVGERRVAMRRLASLGVSPFPLAYAVTRALSEDRVSAASDLLTAREIEVVRALADGLSYRGAGEHLGISWRTVQSHATRAYRKLGASRRSEAVAVARARRLLDR